MATNITEIANDDHLIIEGKLQRQIWGNLTVECPRSNGMRCKLVCSYPCRKVKGIINNFLPVMFQNYARWN